MRGHVEQTIRVIAAEMNTLGWKEELPESMNGLFLLEIMSLSIPTRSVIRDGSR